MSLAQLIDPQPEEKPGPATGIAILAATLAPVANMISNLINNKASIEGLEKTRTFNKGLHGKIKTEMAEIIRLVEPLAEPAERPENLGGIIAAAYKPLLGGVCLLFAGEIIWAFNSYRSGTFSEVAFTPYKYTLFLNTFCACIVTGVGIYYMDRLSKASNNLFNRANELLTWADNIVTSLRAGGPQAEMRFTRSIWDFLSSEFRNASVSNPEELSTTNPGLRRITTG